MYFSPAVESRLTGRGVGPGYTLLREGIRLNEEGAAAGSCLNRKPDVTGYGPDSGMPVLSVTYVDSVRRAAAGGNSPGCEKFNSCDPDCGR